MTISNPQVKEEFDKYEEKLNKAIEYLRGEFLTIRAGRANPQILNKITVDYYGQPTTIPNMANITVPEARMLVISLWDVSMVKKVVSAIQASDIGITPSDDGKVIRLVFPQLTEERRKELTKQTKKLSEDCKVTLRNERRDIMDVLKKFKKDSIITEDEEKTYGAEVQKTLDKYIADVDSMLKSKDAEILEI
ncbi:MAG: ribosome recycling factor [Acutalibacteraceae bacterium]|nr:MAG: ribosome recycling factor [Firmicutes bacterium CAG:552_39_19]